MRLTEGDASDTATLTVSLDRRLYAGETIGVPIALTTSTGARLPGSVDGSNVANHDFTVAAAAGTGHTGVTLANALSANPRVVFTGHGSNTVQTATVTLTPVASRDDGDATDETITATLDSLDGEATAAMLGADYARGKWLVGMALMQSSGEGGYRDTDPGGNVCADFDMDGADPPPDLCDGALRNGDGEVEATLTAALPYAAIQASERLKLWGALGYGTGEVTLKPDLGGRSLTADISWTMAAAGLRGDLLPPPKEGSGPALAVTRIAGRLSRCGSRRGPIWRRRASTFWRGRTRAAGTVPPRPSGCRTA